MKTPASKAKPRPRKLADVPSLTALGLNVKLLRGMRDLSQEQLAELAGMKRGQVGELERGNRGIHLATLDRLAKALDVKPWELLRPRDDTGR